ncbi:MAG: NAD-dependent epimerase/dehydratase family protein [Opitutales bacterium]|nr:NAD-dependent epimerase/dehydratase family protein [Opitutales bacterium]
MIKKVVITGGSGFLGRTLAFAAIKRGWQVVAIARHSDPALIAEGVKFVLVDIANPDSAPLLAAAFSGADIIFHTAAKSDYWGHWKEYRATNIYGTENVIAAAQAAGVPHLVYTSSPSVVYTGEDIINGNESLPYSKVWKESYYAFTKAKAEQAVLAANGKDLKTVALRPHLIWGPGDTHLLPTIVKRTSEGRLRMVGEGHNIVSLTHVANVVHAHMQVADALDSGNGKICGKAYFITDQEGVNLWQWINRILKGLGIPELKRENAQSLRGACCAARLVEIFWHIFSIDCPPPITRFVAKHLARTHTFSTVAAERDFGYYSIIDSEAELAALIESLKKGEM